MTRFDRYLLSQLLAYFGFFSLVLLAVVWINRAVLLFDRLIGDGQSALVFLELTVLSLPSVVRIVLPISAFIAAVYAANRLSGDSELVAAQSAGFSPLRLMRPAAMFGLIVALMLSILGHVLIPESAARLNARNAEISKDMTSRYLREGQFLHPATGVTLFIGDLSQTGALGDVFVSDDRRPNINETHTARTALLVTGLTGLQLIMIDGQTQRLDRTTGQISVTRFADVTYDLSSLARSADDRTRGLEEYSTFELFAADHPARTAALDGYFAEEGHARFAFALLGLATPLIGFAALLLGGFSRFGLTRQIILASLLVIMVEALRTRAAGVVISDASAWPAMYLPALLGIGLGLGLALIAQSGITFRRVAKAGAAA